MSARDLEDEFAGYLARLDRHWEQSAFVAAYIIAANSKKGKAPKMDKLLGPKFPYAAHFRKTRD